MTAPVETGQRIERPNWRFFAAVYVILLVVVGLTAVFAPEKIASALSFPAFLLSVWLAARQHLKAGSVGLEFEARKRFSKAYTATAMTVQLVGSLIGGGLILIAEPALLATFRETVAWVIGLVAIFTLFQAIFFYCMARLMIGALVERIAITKRGALASWTGAA